MTLAEVLVDDKGATFAPERFAPVLEEFADQTLFIGHIGKAEANGRLRALENDLSGLLTVQGKIRHNWVTFERHEDDCPERNVPMDDDPNCECGKEPWQVNRAKASTPGAVAVTFVFCDEEWDA